MVIVIIGILSAVAMRALDGALDRGRFEATVEEMDELVYAMVGNPGLYSGGVRTDFGYFGDVGSLPPNLDALVTNPGYGTWRGPYITVDFTQDPNGYRVDAWGNGYTYQSLTITSSGGGSPITRRVANSMAELTSNTVSGVVLDGVGNPPGTEAANVTVRVSFPSGAGMITTRTTTPNSSGTYSFTSLIPVGNHLIQAIYSATSDTAATYVSIPPGSQVVANLRLPGNLWSAAGGAGLTIVAGTRRTNSSGRDVRFDVQNTTPSGITITSIRADYDRTAWYEEIRIGGTQVFDDTTPRGASGETKTFSPYTIASGNQERVEYFRFRDEPTTPANNVDMRGANFTVTFSDGSVVRFVAGEDDP